MLLRNATPIVFYLCFVFMPVSMADELTNALQEFQHTIVINEQGEFGGKGVNFLLNKASAAQFFMIGETHGIAENPLLMAQLFESLVQQGYQHLAIEVSPPMATHLNQVLERGGLEALKASYRYGYEPAFFGMAEEAELIFRAQKASLNSRALWGLDYEVAGDRLLLDKLSQYSMPNAAQKNFEVIVKASDNAWEKYLNTRGPQYIYSFSGAPSQVKALMDSWPDRTPDTDVILNTLYETLAINRLWVSGRGYESNVRRAHLLKNNFLHYWRDKPTAKVMIKLGASHLMRGVSSNNTFDVGSLVPSLAMVNNNQSFSILVLPGIDSKVAILDPSAWEYKAVSAKDGYSEMAESFYKHLNIEGFTVFDLASLRQTLFKPQYADKENMRKLALQFDALLIMTGSSPSNPLNVTD
ncbi:hypothetical protein DRW07_01570 [Alteromonas sediminis]|uniref:Uncharacterized protein n=1 Tax=Alteromonas sediminis TaxID=2259342 RepID=A0A3N5Y2J7_9ALTE|nr:hypothetical protein [Alteromonas sediminis]RPJ68127.1 hypothetical protein DRW07_01570 [Alteromonas sediminis]